MDTKALERRLIDECRTAIDANDEATYKATYARLETVQADRRREEDAAEARKASPIDAILRDGYRGAPNADNVWLPTLREYRAALAEGADATGGFLVPVQQANTLYDLLRAKSVVLAAGPRIVQMTSDVCRVPKILTSTTTAFYDEGDPLSSTEMTFSSVTLTARKIAAYSLVSNEVLADSVPDLRQVAGTDFAQAMANGLDAAFLAGSGTPPTPKGMRNFTSVGVTHAGASGAPLTLTMLEAQIARLEAANGNLDRAAFFMAPRTWTAIKAMVDDEGMFYLNQDPSGPFKRSIFGVPVYVSSKISIAETVGGSGAVCSYAILADMDQVVVGRRQEITLAYSTDVAFGSDSTAIRATARFDIQPINILGIDVLDGITA